MHFGIFEEMEDLLGRFRFCFRGPSWRRFYTREEKIAELEQYREHLKKELAGVEEAIEKLKKQNF